ncbi:hypothetical protein HERIO_2791 [Hepatospora eriocheir]|uniref:Secreted protein n=1 Tax=Hepatospora eriocheir TaxID=1081669 RepID=A0A1X0Q695_9MICR|nr:hypothetical protein HERIO_2791 [Hepatospora eriocheir]
MMYRFVQGIMVGVLLSVSLQDSILNLNKQVMSMIMRKKRDLHLVFLTAINTVILKDNFQRNILLRNLKDKFQKERKHHFYNWYWNQFIK